MMWQIDKKASHKAVLVDVEKRILSYDGKLFWVRIAGKDGTQLYIYSLEKYQKEKQHE
jgi:hypothetical protein